MDGREKSPYYDLLFSGFKGRHEGLTGVERFYLMPLMYYRTNLLDHGLMVSWMVEELLPYAEKTFDHFTPEVNWRMKVRSLVHDDPEQITGDPSLADKLKEDFKQREVRESLEQRAIRKLASQRPEMVGGLPYLDLMFEAHEKETLDTQFGSYADKLVGFGEALHEVYAGNEEFHQPDTSGEIPVVTYLDKVFPNRKEKWPLLKPLFEIDHPLLNLSKKFDVDKILETCKPHTEESVLKPTGLPIYDAWKEVILRRGGKYGLELLVKQREFPSLKKSDNVVIRTLNRD